MDEILHIVNMMAKETTEPNIEEGGAGEKHNHRVAYNASITLIPHMCNISSTHRCVLIDLIIVYLKMKFTNS